MANSVEEYQQRIAYFEKSSETKNKITKSEGDRLKLEIELNRLINSDQAQLKTKGSKLKAYYTKLCEDEGKSMKRNQQLLADLQRIDSQFNQLEVKLERLSSLKKECELYLQTAYPQWTAENKIFPGEQHPRSNMNVTQNLNYENISSSLAKIVIPSVKSEESNFKTDYTSQNKPPTQNDDQNYGIRSLVGILKSNTAITDQQRLTSLKNLQQDQFHQNYPSKETKQATSNEFISQLVASAYNQSLIENKFPNQLNNQERNQSNFNNDTLIKEYERELKRQDTNLIENTLTSSLNYLNPLHSTSAPENQINTSEKFQREDDLNKWSASPITQHREPRREIINEADELSEARRKNSLRQELNLDALFYLLDHIELEVTHTIHPEKYYRQVEPHYKNKLEIIRLARDNKPLNDIDPADITMIILDQLSGVIKKNTKNKCIFTPDLMGLSVTDINENVVSNYLKDQKDKELWIRLIKHWNYLKRYASIDAYTLAGKFASSLLGANTTGVEKAIKFLEKIISNNSQHDPLNDSKSVTETSLNQELNLVSNSKLKESLVYQDFIMNTSQKSQSHKKSHDMEDDDDEIDAMVAPKSTGGSGNSKNYVLSNTMIKSPRQPLDYEFDFSQNSVSESQKKAISLKQSLRSSKDKKLPAHLRGIDSSDESSESSENTQSKTKNKSMKSDSDFDFYN